MINGAHETLQYSTRLIRDGNQQERPLKGSPSRLADVVGHRYLHSTAVYYVVGALIVPGRSVANARPLNGQGLFPCVYLVVYY